MGRLSAANAVGGFHTGFLQGSKISQKLSLALYTFRPVGNAGFVMVGETVIFGKAQSFFPGQFLRSLRLSEDHHPQVL